MHGDEVPIDATTVKALVGDQFSQWSHLPVARLIGHGGTVNAIFRLGEELTAHFPLQRREAADAAAWLTAEAAAQRELAEISPVPTPRPVAIGRQGWGYPMPFAVQTWVPGSVPAVGEWADSTELADGLARLIGALRAAPTRGRAFAGHGRGGQLASHDAWMRECVSKNAPWFDAEVTGAIWSRLRELPRDAASSPDVMTHGDLIPGNVLVDDGRLVGLLDGGGFGPADPALDLVAAWHLLDGPRRERLRSALGCLEVEWERGRAWAFVQAMGLVHYYEHTNPGMHALGLRTLGEAIATL